MMKIMIRENTVNEAPIKPKILISVAIFSNFTYKGVYSSSASSVNFSLIYPAHESLPTTIQTNKPSPEMILVPESKIGDGIFLPLYYSS